MSETERLYKIIRLLKNRKYVSTRTFIDELSISKSTLKRDLDCLRDRLQTPIEYDRDMGGYHIEKKSNKNGDVHELPGLWFNASEIHALLTMQHLLSNIDPGLLSQQIEPLKERLKTLLEKNDFSGQEINDRIRLVHATKRPVVSRCFELLATATLGRNRIIIRHHNRKENTNLDREVSPQQLIFYRYNWYLDAWCHVRNNLRSFAVDAISSVEITDKPTKNVTKKVLREHFESGYGIFAGTQVTWAKLRFSPESARWVSKEEWHGQQKSSFDKNGFYILEVPYSDDRELSMEILKYGTEVEVLEPTALREKIKETLGSALKTYTPK